MVITYELGSALYINLTNKCTNNCDFCVRNNENGIKEGMNLWLEREPSVKEVVDDLNKRDIESYSEIVFCGYGEPTIRINAIIEVAKFIKQNWDIKTRINTNGQANLIFKKDITPLLKDIIDEVSISLNAKNAKEYQEICHSTFGEDAFYGLIDFGKKAKIQEIDVTYSIVDTLSKEDIEMCRKIANNAGGKLRIRELIK